MKDLTGHIPGDHGADAERESADGADEGEENAAEGDPCEPLALMGDEVRRKDEDGEYVRIKSAHVHPDGDRWKAYGNGDRRGGKTSRGGFPRRGCGEHRLHVGLCAEDAYHHREKTGQGRIRTGAEKGEPRRIRKDR